MSDYVIHNDGIIPHTRHAVLATQIELQISGRPALNPVGGMQTIRARQSRTVDRVRHLNVFNPGEIVDMVPENIQGTLTVSKLWLHTGRILQVLSPERKGEGLFGEDVRSVHDPWKVVSLLDSILLFDIEIWMSPGNKNFPLFPTEMTNLIKEQKFLLETYTDCVISSYNFSAAITGNLLISEEATIEFKDKILGSRETTGNQTAKNAYAEFFKTGVNGFSIHEGVLEEQVLAEERGPAGNESQIDEGTNSQIDITDRSAGRR